MTRRTARHSAIRHEARAIPLTFSPAQVSAIMHEVVPPMIKKLPLQRNDQTTTLEVRLHSHQIQRNKALYYGSLNWGFLKVQEEQDR